jgi:hypothetical protein
VPGWVGGDEWRNLVVELRVLEVKLLADVLDRGFGGC